MPSITWLFSTSTSWLGFAIRWKECGQCSHVDVVTEDGAIPGVAGGLLLGAQLHESDGNGMLARKPDYQTFARRVQVTTPVTEEQYRLFWGFMAAQIGKPYDLEDYLDIMRGSGEVIDGKRWICSEVQAAACQHATILRVDKCLSLIDPELLRMLLMEKQGATEVML